jgi:hypothetical protein
VAPDRKRKARPTPKRSEQEAREAQWLAEQGWYSHYVFGVDLTRPHIVDAHTHGLREKFGVPEFQIVLKLPQGMVNELFHVLVDRLKTGARFEAGKDYSDVLSDGFLVRMVAASDSFGVTVLRVILPDSQGNFGATAEPPWNDQFPVEQSN